VTWLDVAGKMADASGELADRFSGDGLHLSGAGYGAWADVVRPLLP
jgi:lysophospholipase L1-like esterase